MRGGILLEFGVVRAAEIQASARAAVLPLKGWKCGGILVEVVCVRACACVLWSGPSSTVDLVNPSHGGNEEQNKSGTASG